MRRKEPLDFKLPNHQEVVNLHLQGHANCKTRQNLTSAHPNTSRDFGTAPLSVWFLVWNKVSGAVTHCGFLPL